MPTWSFRFQTRDSTRLNHQLLANKATAWCSIPGNSSILKSTFSKPCRRSINWFIFLFQKIDSRWSLRSSARDLSFSFSPNSHLVKVRFSSLLCSAHTLGLYWAYEHWIRWAYEQRAVPIVPAPDGRAGAASDGLVSDSCPTRVLPLPFSRENVSCRHSATWGHFEVSLRSLGPKNLFESILKICLFRETCEGK